MKKMISTLLSAAVLTSAVPMTIPASLSAVSAQEVAEDIFMTVSEIGEDYIVVAGGGYRALQLNIGEETIIIDSETKTAVGIADLQEGDKLLCEFGDAMTKSIPPQVGAEVIALNADKGGNVKLIDVDKVEKDEDGNLIVTDEDKDLELTILKTATVKPYMTRNIVKLDDIAEGMKLLAWYETETLSLPAQATTENVVLIPEIVVCDDENENEDENETIEIVTKEYSGMTEIVTISKVGNDYILASDEDGNEIQLNIDEETILINSEKKTALNLKDLKKGEKVLCEYDEAKTKSIPPQVNASLVVSDFEKGGNVNLIDVDGVEKDEDGNLIVIDEDKDLELTISKAAKVAPYKTKNIVKLNDIEEGTKLLAWYDFVTMSIPARAATENVMIIAENVKKEETSGNMADDASDWAKDDISSAEKLGMFLDTILSCKNEINREQFCEIVYNILKTAGLIKDIDKDFNFKDTKNNKVNHLAKMGIISGKGDGKFAPNDLITREEAASIMDRIANFAGLKPEGKADKFADDDRISDWAKNSVYSLSSMKIISGTDRGFEPKSNITVEQSASLLMRMHKLIKGRR